MKIYEFLKVKKVKCIDVSGMCLSKDKEYQLLGVTDKSCIINDDDGYEVFASIERFEPVLDNDNINMDELVKHLAVGKNWKEIGCDHIVTITEISSDFASSTMVVFESDCCLSSSPLEMFLKDFEPMLDNDMSKSVPEIDISENSVNAVNNVIPTFKVGDKVYFPNMAEGKVLTLLDNKACHYQFFVDVANKVNNSLYELDSNGRTKYGNFANVVVKATQENYEMLCKLYPRIEFEQPPKEVTGSDLCRAMLEKGWHLVPCVVSHISDSEALSNDNCCLVDEWYSSSFDSCFNSGDYSYKYAVPFDPKTGVPLTEDVLNDIN